MGLPKASRLHVIGGLAIFLAVLAFYRFSVHDRFVALNDSWEKESAMEAKIIELREENSHLEQVIEDLNPDGKEIDRIIRENLRWIGPTESMIDIPSKE